MTTRPAKRGKSRTTITHDPFGMPFGLGLQVRAHPVIELRRPWLVKFAAYAPSAGVARRLADCIIGVEHDISDAGAPRTYYGLQALWVLPKRSHVQQSNKHFSGPAVTFDRRHRGGHLQRVEDREFAIPPLTHVIATTRHVTGRVAPTRFSGTPRTPQRLPVAPPPQQVASHRPRPGSRQRDEGRHHRCERCGTAAKGRPARQRRPANPAPRCRATREGPH